MKSIIESQIYASVRLTSSMCKAFLRASQIAQLSNKSVVIKIPIVTYYHIPILKVRNNNRNIEGPYPFAPELSPPFIIAVA